MPMDVEIDARYLAIGGIVALLLLFGVLGRLVTPVEAGEARVLTPARWHAIRLARQAARETEALYQDARDLRGMLARGRPSPVDAMLLAERIYARHREGTSATGPAREALIAAAEAAARFATGAASREEAVAAANRAFALLEGLRAQERRARARERHSLPYIAVTMP